MAALSPDRHSPTTGLHSGTRLERVTYTNTSGCWWSFKVDLPKRFKCMTWPY